MPAVRYSSADREATRTGLWARPGHVPEGRGRGAGATHPLLPRGTSLRPSLAARSPIGRTPTRLSLPNARGPCVGSGVAPALRPLTARCPTPPPAAMAAGFGRHHALFLVVPPLA